MPTKKGALGYHRPVGAWRSLVAHLVWDQRVGGSNPLAPTILIDAGLSPGKPIDRRRKVAVEMDPLLLARLQFAANISFHILFPSISIALAWVLLFFKWRFARTRNQLWLDAYRLWVKIFALTFALGVVSGVTMSFQFGTNWPGFMETVGNVAGPLLAYEVLTAFFLEATFLAVMLFGIGKVSDRMHTLATVLVAVGTSMSAFWILVLNSWMQTPAGHVLVDGRIVATGDAELALELEETGYVGYSK